MIDDQGDIMTNDHVVAQAQKLQVQTTDGRSYPATLVGRDPRTDLAVVRVQGAQLPRVPLGDSSRLQVGQWVVAIGNALALDGGPTVTAQTDSIRTVRDASLETVCEIGEGGRTKTILAAGRLKNFRASFGMTKRAAKKGICIDAEAAELLEVKVGDQVLAVAR